MRFLWLVYRNGFLMREGEDYTWDGEPGHGSVKWDVKMQNGDYVTVLAIPQAHRFDSMFGHANQSDQEFAQKIQAVEIAELEG